MTTSKDLLDQLLKAYEEHNNLRVPRASERDDDVYSARADLMQYTGHVSGVVQRVLGGHPVKAEWLNPDQGLDTLITSLLASRPEEERRLLEEYRRYKQHLDELLHLASEVLREQNRQA